MEFTYTAQDSLGKRVSANVSADSIANALRIIKGKGLLPLDIKEAKPQAARIVKNFFTERKAGNKDLAIFARQLAVSLKAGILLTEALETVAQDWEDAGFRKIIKQIIEEIRAGESFSAALEKRQRMFSPTFIAMVKAGEESGSLNVTMASLAKYLEDTERIVQKLKTAIRYPLFILGFFIFTLFVMTVFIIPKFSQMFVRSGIKLHWLTQAVIGVSSFVIHNIVWIPIVVALVLFGLWFTRRIPKGSFYLDEYKFRIPLFGGILRKTLTARFARTLSVLLSSGAGLAAALTISSQTSGNEYFNFIVTKIKERVFAGFNMSDEMDKQKFFQKIFVKMIRVGEKTGKFSEMCERNAEYYEEEVDRSIANMMSTLEPTLIVLIGGMVAIVVLALYLPIFQMSTIRR